MYGTLLGVAQGGAQLNAAERIHARTLGKHRRLFVARKGIVIGNGNRLELMLGCGLDQLLRRVGAVGFGGMSMKVDHWVSGIRFNSRSLTRIFWMLASISSVEESTVISGFAGGS